MSWLKNMTDRVVALFTPSAAQIAEVLELGAKTQRIRQERVEAHRTLEAANEQAQKLQAMDARNHYSESMTHAMRGNRA